MDKEDARYQTLAQLHERRKQVVRLHNKGIKIMAIVGLTGLTYPDGQANVGFVSARWLASDKSDEPGPRKRPRSHAKR